MIDFRAVSYRYPRLATAALADVSLHVDTGEFIVLTGESGSGKSTLLRCANGLIPHFYGGAFGGRVLVAGVDTRVASTAGLSQQVGFMAQEPETQTITERVTSEIGFGPENLGLSRRDVAARVDEVLAALGIEALREREISTLSGGERQRVALSAALALRPRVLALDEPVSQLDPAAAATVIGALETLHREHGTAILVAEHRIDRLLAPAERLFVLEDGRLVAGGAPRQVLAAAHHRSQLAQMADVFGWDPVPLSVAEARERLHRDPSHRSPSPPAERNDEPLTAGNPLVELRGITVAYGSQPVLSNVSVDFQAGRVTALLGRSGSGKTTLLKLLNGLLRPAAGSVRVLGEDIARRGVQEMARFVAYLPQNPAALLFNDTVEQELLFTLRCRNAGADVRESLQRFGLESMARRSPFDLSGGQRQRAALAAVLIGTPPIALLDEPTRGMDSRRRNELAAVLRGLARQGITVIVATHDVELAVAAADDAVLLEDGRIARAGPVRAVLPGHPVFAPLVSRILGSAVLTVADITPSRDRISSEHEVIR